jgi:hypothetical protein
VVVGHTIIPYLSHTLNHPLYGDKVVMIDSAISIAYGGELTAIEVSGGRIAQFNYDRWTGQRRQIAQKAISSSPALICSQALN